MATPPTAVPFTQTLDPHEQIDFVVDCAGLLEDYERIADYTLTLYAEAVALGLEIMTGSGRDHGTIEDDAAIRLWLEIDSAFEGNAAFEGVGTALPIDVIIITDSVPARTRNRTVLVRVAQQ